MTWPTPYVWRDADDVIAARHAALLTDHRDDLRAAAARRTARQAQYAKLAASNSARYQAARRDLIEDVEWLLPTETPDAICERLGSSLDAITKRLYRAGRPDLAKPFERVRQARRRCAA